MTRHICMIPGTYNCTMDGLPCDDCVSEEYDPYEIDQKVFDDFVHDAAEEGQAIVDHDLIFLRNPTPKEEARIIELYGTHPFGGNYYSTTLMRQSCPCISCTRPWQDCQDCELPLAWAKTLPNWTNSFDQCQDCKGCDKPDTWPDDGILMDEIDAYMDEQRQERSNDETLNSNGLSDCHPCDPVNASSSAFTANRLYPHGVWPMIFSIVAGLVVAYILLGR